MIKNIADLANALSGNGSVKVENVSKALSKRISLWAKRKEVIVNNGIITGNF